MRRAIDSNSPTSRSTSLLVAALVAALAMAIARGPADGANVAAKTKLALAAACADPVSGYSIMRVRNSESVGIPFTWRDVNGNSGSGTAPSNTDTFFSMPGTGKRSVTITWSDGQAKANSSTGACTGSVRVGKSVIGEGPARARYDIQLKGTTAGTPTDSVSIRDGATKQVDLPTTLALGSFPIGDTGGGFTYTITETETNGADSVVYSRDSVQVKEGTTEEVTVINEFTEKADLVLAKDASPATFFADDQALYTLVITNKGPDAATQTTLVDTLPAGTSVAQITAGDGSCSSSPQTVTCSLGTIHSGGGAQVLIAVNVAAGTEGQSLTNTATVTAKEEDPNPGDNTASVTSIVSTTAPSGEADLRITKSANHSRVATGQTITYTVKITNAGSVTIAAITATNVRVYETPIAEFDLVSVTASEGTCTRGPPLSCRIGSIAPGQTVTITAKVVPLKPGPIVNAVSVTADTKDPVITNFSTARVDVDLGDAKIRVTKRASVSHTKPGRKFTYTITISNRGPSDVVELRLCDRLPSGLSLVSARGAKLDRGRVCWSYDEIGDDAKRTVTLKVRTLNSAGSSLRNTARATSLNAASASGIATITTKSSSGGGSLLG